MDKFSPIYAGIIVPAAILLPIYWAIRHYGRLDKALKVLLVYLVLAGITNIIASVLADRNINNLFLLHIYSAVEFTVISAYFYYLFKADRVKKVILGLVVIYLVFCLVNAVYLQRTDEFNTYTRSIQAVVLPFYSILYLYYGVGSFLRGQRRDPHYWIQVGLIAYFMSSLMQFSFSNFFRLHLEKETRIWLWNFHATMVLLMYLVFARAYFIVKE